MTNNYEATQPMAGERTTEANDDVISTLNSLIEICKDGQDGYKDAAEGVERSDLKSIFYEFSQQRAEFTGVLQGLVRDLGGDPETGGSFSGAIHRGWINIKSAVTGKDAEAILNECERGEDSAKEAYADAEKLNLPANVASVIRQQAQSVQAAHNRIRELRDAENRRADNDTLEDNTETRTATPGGF